MFLGTIRKALQRTGAQIKFVESLEDSQGFPWLFIDGYPSGHVLGPAWDSYSVPDTSVALRFGVFSMKIR